MSDPAAKPSTEAAVAAPPTNKIVAGIKKEDDGNESTAPSISSQTTSATAAAASTDTTGTLRVVINLFVAHMLVNTLLLSPWNELRCAYWNKPLCSTDESWICNWFCYSHLHVSVLLAALAYSAQASREQLEKLGYLICSIILCHLGTGIAMLDMLDRTMASLQCLVYAGVVSSILYLTYQDPEDMRTRELTDHVAKLNLSDASLSLSNSSSFGRKKYSLSTMAVGMHLISSIIRVMDMTFGDGRNGYKGDMSSPIYQAISNFAVMDMLIASTLLLFALLFFRGDQHKMVLYAQGFVLMVSLYMLLISSQGDGIQADMVVAGSVGSFVFWLVSLVGAI